MHEYFSVLWVAEVIDTYKIYVSSKTIFQKQQYETSIFYDFYVMTSMFDVYSQTETYYIIIENVFDIDFKFFSIIFSLLYFFPLSLMLQRII